MAHAETQKDPSEAVGDRSHMGASNAQESWGATPPVLSIEGRSESGSSLTMILSGTREHKHAAAMLGLHRIGLATWRVTGWHRLRALWPFADDGAGAVLLDRLKEHNRPARWPPIPFLTTDKFGFVFVGGRHVAGFARDAGFRWDRERLVWRCDQRYGARHLWVFADEFADRRLTEEFAARARPTRVLALPTLFFDEERFVYTSTFDGRDTPREAGFRWDPADKVWFTRQVPVALRVHANAEPRLQEVLRRTGARPPFAALAKLSILDFVDVMEPDEVDADSELPSRAAPTRTELVHVLSDGRFCCDDPSRALKAGFQVDDQGCWFTSDVRVAAALRAFADLRAERAIQEELSEAFAAQIAQVKAPLGDDIPAPPGLSYMPYQRDGIAFAAARENTLLGDEMGLGKTVQALGLINVLRPCRTLIVCPAMLCLNWVREARRWLPSDLPVCLLGEGQASPAVVTGAGPITEGGDPERVMVTSYDSLHRLSRRDWDLIVFDEAHYLKNPSARRTAAALGGSGVRAPRRLFMTGTPVFNRPQDLWTILSTSLPHIFHQQSRFKDLYAVADPRAISHEKQDNLTVLGRILAKTIMLRRLKADVLRELPEKTWQVVLMDVGKDAGEALARDEWAAMARFREAVSVNASMLQRSQILAEIAALRRKTAEAKVPAAIEHVQSVAEQGEPIIVFTYHRDVARHLAAGLCDAGVHAVTIDGSVPPHTRQRMVDAFQSGEGDVLIATMDAAGVGLTMTRAALVAFLELDWTPAKMRQAEDRAHRHGQNRPVVVQYLVVDGTIDAYIAELVQSKTDMAASTLGDDLATLDRMLTDPGSREP